MRSAAVNWSGRSTVQRRPGSACPGPARARRRGGPGSSPRHRSRCRRRWRRSAISPAIRCTACCDEPQAQSIAGAGGRVRQTRVQPGVAGDVVGLLARLGHAAADDLADDRRVEAGSFEQPGLGERRAARRGAGPARTPLRRPTGVRTASTMTASGMCSPARRGSAQTRACRLRRMAEVMNAATQRRSESHPVGRRHDDALALTCSAHEHNDLAGQDRRRHRSRSRPRPRRGPRPRRRRRQRRRQRHGPDAATTSSPRSRRSVPARSRSRATSATGRIGDRLVSAAVDTLRQPRHRRQQRRHHRATR